MNREDRRRARRWRKAWRTGRGQALTELAMILPLLAAILFGIVELSGAYSAKMDLQAAAAQAARIGALAGSGVSGATEGTSTNTIDQAMLQAILRAHGLDPNNVEQIQIYRAAPDGSIDGGIADTYTAPFTATTAATSYNWPLANRFAGEPSDSIGVHITYRYHPITPLFGMISFNIDDQTVQRLNPTKNEVPCPIPGIPINVTAPYTPAEPPPSPQDVISWDQVPGAMSYNIYVNVDGSGFGTLPIYSGAGTVSNGRVSVTYTGNTTYAPAAYEVTGVNDCGEGERSLPAGNGQCTLPVTPTNVVATAAITPDNDLVRWTGVPAAQTYAITQTNDAGFQSAFTVTAPLTSDVIANNGYDHKTYQVTATTACGVTGPVNAPPADNSGCTPPSPPTLQSIMPISRTDVLTWTATGPITATGWLVTQMITGTGSLTQTVPITMNSAVISNTNRLAALYTVQGLSRCGGHGLPSALKPNGR